MVCSPFLRDADDMSLDDGNRLQVIRQPVILSCNCVGWCRRVARVVVVGGRAGAGAADVVPGLRRRQPLRAHRRPRGRHQPLRRREYDHK